MAVYTVQFIPSARGQKAIVQLFDLGLDGFEGRFRLRSFAQEHYAFHDIVVINDPTIGAVNGFSVLT